MSFQKINNAVLALLRDDYRTARELLRSPELRINDIAGLQCQVQMAIRDREDRSRVQVLQEILQSSLSLSCTGIEGLDGPERANAEEAYFLGITAVEGLIEARLGALKGPVVEG